MNEATLNFRSEYQVLASTSGQATCANCGVPATVAIRKADLSGWFFCDHHLRIIADGLAMLPDCSNRQLVRETYEKIATAIAAAILAKGDSIRLAKARQLLMEQPEPIRPYLALRVHERLSCADLRAAEDWFALQRDIAFIGLW